MNRIVVLKEDSGGRLDSFLNNKYPEYSRSFFKNLIDSGSVKVNGTVISKAGYITKAEDHVEFLLPDYSNLDSNKNADLIDAKILFIHDHFLIIEKGAGVLVHSPSDKSDAVTLVDWLISKFKEIELVGQCNRPGIVHRLDMDTSGLMIIARTNYGHKIFSDMFKDRKIKKEYKAVVKGSPSESGTIDLDIVRHPSIRTRMMAVQKKDASRYRFANTKSAVTDFKVDKYFKEYSLVTVMPKTGRTHQIRVHFAAIGSPLIGDVIYGSSSKLIKRHALHASKLEFIFDGKNYSFESDLPDDIKLLI